eukprot:1545263-Pyramimonas_sp.AAC.1
MSTSTGSVQFDLDLPVVRRSGVAPSSTPARPSRFHCDFVFVRPDQIGLVDPMLWQPTRGGPG